MVTATTDLWLPSQPQEMLPFNWYQNTLLGDRHVCEQFAQDRYLTAQWHGVEIATSQVARPLP